MGVAGILGALIGALFTIWIWSYVFKWANKQSYPYIPIGKLRLQWNGIEYDCYYLYWWNWLPKSMRYWGREDIYFDTPHATLGLWFTNVAWFLPWGKYNY